MKQIENFETPRCTITVYESTLSMYYPDGKDERLYIIISNDKKTGAPYIRYGNYIQMRSIINTYEHIRSKD